MLFPPLQPSPKICQPPSILLSSQWHCNRILTLFLLLFPSFQFFLYSPFLPFLLIPSYLPSIFCFFLSKNICTWNTVRKHNHTPPCGSTRPKSAPNKDSSLHKNRILGPIYPRNHALTSYFFPECQYLSDSDLNFSLLYISSEHRWAWESRHLLGSIQMTNFLVYRSNW